MYFKITKRIHKLKISFKPYFFTFSINFYELKETVKANNKIYYTKNS